MNIAGVVQAVATLSWLLAIGAIAFGVFRAARGGGFKAGAPIVIVAVVLALALTAVSAGLVFVQPEERGVVISALQPGGYRPEAFGPGLHWIIPFAENVKTYSISRNTYTMSAVAQEGQVPGDDSVRARTKDGQEVFIDASVIYSIDPTKVVELNIRWQDRYEQGVVRPVVRGIIRDTASQYGVEEIVSSKRAEMEQIVTDEVAANLAENDLILVDFVLRDIHFSTEYAAAVEQKQIAEQLAQQAKFVVEQKKQEAEQARQVAQGQADAAVIASKGAAEARVINAEAEAKSKVINAEADAKALALIAAQLRNNPALVTYRYVEKLSPGIQVMLVPSDNPFLLPLPELTPTTPTPR